MIVAAAALIVGTGGFGAVAVTAALVATCSTTAIAATAIATTAIMGYTFIKINDFDDPTKPPSEGFEWRGKGEPGSGKGNWYNPKTGESLHPDLKHSPGIPPHWDYKDSTGILWRIYRFFMEMK